jgi:hypothetical protein
MSFRIASALPFTTVAILLLPAVGSPVRAQEPTWETVMMEPTASMTDLCILPDGLHGWAIGRLA